MCATLQDDVESFRRRDEQKQQALQTRMSQLESMHERHPPLESAEDLRYVQSYSNGEQNVQEAHGGF
jgi:hypothetical protein